ncbi:Ig-like domain-containing protein, partial [Singulisphaera rosea]
TGTVTFEVVVSETFDALVSPSLVPGAILGTVPLSASGTATLVLPSMPAGTVNIEAFYSGDPTHEAYLSAPLSQTTTTAAAASSTTLFSSQGEATAGQAITFTAIVSPIGTGLPAPTGTVTFFDQTTNQPLGDATLSSTGEGSLSTSNLAVGGHSIVATYHGNTVLASSASLAFDEIIQAAVTPIYLPPPSTVPGSVTQLIPTYLTVRGRRFLSFEVRVAPVGAFGTGEPSGTVTLVFGPNHA